ncbi:MAG: hypothetical protein HYY96_17775 [Candidatus Tectomicrobia bacterium]|nr:hypothetical protein [Candidatus Tectomicrobia bacterium]
MAMPRFTEKSQEALLEAERLAEARGHASVEALHLLAALVAQQDGVVPLVLRAAGVEAAGLARQIEAALHRLPVVQGAVQRAPGESLRAALRRAEEAEPVAV